MYVGTQVGARDDVDLRQWAQLGVVNVCNDPREAMPTPGRETILHAGASTSTRSASSWT